MPIDQEREVGIQQPVELPSPPLENTTLVEKEGDAAEQALWYAIRSKGKQESIAKFHYERQGYSVYLPQLRTTVRHARQTTEKLTAFFPGYLFLHLTPAERNWATISATRGAAGPLRFGNTYVPIPDWVIADLKAREDHNRTIPMADLMREKLTPGCKVSVNLAGVENIEGVVYSTRGSKNVEVLLTILGRQVKTQVALTHRVMPAK